MGLYQDLARQEKPSLMSQVTPLLLLLLQRMTTKLIFSVRTRKMTLKLKE